MRFGTYVSVRLPPVRIRRTSVTQRFFLCSQNPSLTTLAPRQSLLSAAPWVDLHFLECFVSGIISSFLYILSLPRINWRFAHV